MFQSVKMEKIPEEARSLTPTNSLLHLEDDVIVLTPNTQCNLIRSLRTEVAEHREFKITSETCAAEKVANELATTLNDTRALLIDARKTISTLKTDKGTLEDELHNCQTAMCTLKKDTDLKIFQLQQDVGRKQSQIDHLLKDRLDYELQFSSLSNNHTKKVDELTLAIAQSQKNMVDHSEQTMQPLQLEIISLKNLITDLEKSRSELTDQSTSWKNRAQVLETLLELQTERADKLSTEFSNCLVDFQGVAQDVEDVLKSQRAWEPPITQLIGLSSLSSPKFLSRNDFEGILKFSFPTFNAFPLEDYTSNVDASLSEIPSKSGFQLILNDLLLHLKGEEIEDVQSQYDNLFEILTSIAKDLITELKYKNHLLSEKMSECNSINYDQTKLTLSLHQLNAESSTLRDANLALKENIIKKRSDNDSLQSELNNLKITVQDLKKSTLSEAAINHEHANEIVKLNDENLSLKQEIEKLEKKLSSLEMTTKSLPELPRVKLSLSMIQNDGPVKSEEELTIENVNAYNLKEESIALQTSGMTTFMSANDSIQNNSRMGLEIKQVFTLPSGEQNDIESFARSFSEVLVANQVFHDDDVPPSDSSVFYFLLDRYCELVEAFRITREEILILNAQHEAELNKTASFLQHLNSPFTSDLSQTNSLIDMDVPSSTMCDSRFENTMSNTIADETHDPLLMTPRTPRQPFLNGSPRQPFLNVVRVSPLPPRTPTQVLLNGPLPLRTPTQASLNGSRAPLSPLTNTPLQKILRREPCSGIKKNVTFRSPIGKNVAMENENIRLQKLLDDKISICLSLEEKVGRKTLELESLQSRIEEVETLAQKCWQDLESELMLENEKLKKDIVDLSEQLQTLRCNLVGEAVNLDPNLEPNMESLSADEVLSLFLKTIMEKCKSLQETQKECFEKDRLEWNAERLQFAKSNQSLEEEVRQQKFQLVELKALINVATESKLEQADEMKELIGEIGRLKVENSDLLSSISRKTQESEEILMEKNNLSVQLEKELHALRTSLKSQTAFQNVLEKIFSEVKAVRIELNSVNEMVENAHKNQLNDSQKTEIITKLESYINLTPQPSCPTEEISDISDGKNISSELVALLVEVRNFTKLACTVTKEKLALENDWKNIVDNVSAMSNNLETEKGIKDALQGEKKEWEQEKSKLSQDIIDLKSTIDFLISQKTSAEEDALSYESMKEALNSEVITLKSAILTLEQKISVLEPAAIESQENCNKLNAEKLLLEQNLCEAETLKQEYEMLLKLNEALKCEMNCLRVDQSALSDKDSQIEEVNNRFALLSAENTSLKNTVAKSLEGAAEIETLATKEKEELELKLAAAASENESTVCNLEREISQLKNNIVELTEKVSLLTNESLETKEHIEKLLAEKDVIIKSKNDFLLTAESGISELLLVKDQLNLVNEEKRNLGLVLKAKDDENLTLKLKFDDMTKTLLEIENTNSTLTNMLDVKQREYATLLCKQVVEDICSSVVQRKNEDLLTALDGQNKVLVVENEKLQLLISNQENVLAKLRCEMELITRDLQVSLEEKNTLCSKLCNEKDLLLEGLAKAEGEKGTLDALLKEKTESLSELTATNEKLLSSLDKLKDEIHSIKEKFFVNEKEATQSLVAAIQTVKIEKENLQQMFQQLREELQAQHKSFQTEVSGLQAKVNDFERSGATVELLKKDIELLKHTLVEAENDKQVLLSQVETLRTEKHSLLPRLDSLERDLTAAQQLLTLSEEQKVKFSLEIEALQKELDTKTQAVERLNVENSDLSAIRDTYNEQNQLLKVQLESVEGHNIELKKEVNRYRDTEVAILLKLQDKQKSDEAALRLAEELASIKKELSLQISQKDEGNKKIDALNNELDKLTAEVQERCQIIKELESALENYKVHIAKLETSVQRASELNKESLLKVEMLLSSKTKDLQSLELKRQELQNIVEDLRGEIVVKSEEGQIAKQLVAERDITISDLNCKVKELDGDNSEMKELLFLIPKALGLPDEAVHNISKTVDRKSFLKFFTDHRDNVVCEVDGLRRTNDDLNVQIKKLTSEKLEFEIKAEELIDLGKNQEEIINSLRNKLGNLESGLERKSRRSDHFSSRRLDKLEELNKCLHDLLTKLLLALHYPGVDTLNLIAVRGFDSATKSVLAFAAKIALETSELKEKMKELDQENEELSDTVEELLAKRSELELRIFKIEKDGSSPDCRTCPKLRSKMESQNEEISRLNDLKLSNENKITALETNLDELKNKCITMENAATTIKTALKEKEDQLLRSLNRNSGVTKEVFRLGSGSNGLSKEDVSEKYKSLCKNYEMLKQLLRQRNQRIKELEEIVESRKTMHANQMNSPIRERSYNLRNRNDVAAAYKLALKTRVGGQENL